MNDRTTMNGKPVFTVPAKTVINFDSRFREKLLCDGTTFTAGTSCPYSCAFCYVDTQMQKQYGPNGWLTKQGVTGNHADIVVRRADAVAIARKQLLAHPEPERMQKKVIYGSPLTDVAANLELVRETVEICKVILELTNWDIRLLSKSNLLPKVAETIYECQPCDEFPTWSDRMIFGISTGTLEDGLAATIEQKTPLVSQRLKSLHWLQDNGFRTFGMICPNLPTWSPGESDELAYLKFARAMAAAIRAEKCEHIWAEVINLRGDNLLRTHKALRDAGYGAMSDELHRIIRDHNAWEEYARQTFLAHSVVYAELAGYQPGATKLRFLQYTTKATRQWWESYQKDGAVVLGRKESVQSSKT